MGGWARRIDFAREPSVSDSSAPSVLLTQFMGHVRTRWSLNHVIDLTPYAARCQQCHVKWSASRYVLEFLVLVVGGGGGGVIGGIY